MRSLAKKDMWRVIGFTRVHHKSIIDKKSPIAYKDFNFSEHIEAMSAHLKAANAYKAKDAASRAMNRFHTRVAHQHRTIAQWFERGMKLKVIHGKKSGPEPGLRSSD